MCVLSGRDIRPDELIVEDSADLKLDFDGKRDRYGGYDPVTYQLVVRDFELADAERKKRKGIELEKGLQEKSGKRKKRRAEGKGERSDSERCK